MKTFEKSQCFLGKRGRVLSAKKSFFALMSGTLKLIDKYELAAIPF